MVHLRVDSLSVVNSFFVLELSIERVNANESVCIENDVSQSKANREGVDVVKASKRNGEVNRNHDQKRYETAWVALKNKNKYLCVNRQQTQKLTAFVPLTVFHAINMPKACRTI